MTTAIILAALALAANPAQEPPTAPPAPKPADTATAVEGVTVSAAKAEIQTSIDRRSYSVAADLQGQTGNIADVLRNIPSVQVDLQGNLSLRGDPSVTVLLDGQPSSQFKGDSLAMALQAMPANRIERIEVVTNPSAAFNTEGAGVINLITKKATGEGRTGSVQAQVGHYGNARLALNGGYNSARLRLTADLSGAHQIQDQIQRNRRFRLGVAALASDERVTQDGKFDATAGRIGAEYDLDARTRLSGDLRATYGARIIDAASQFEGFDAVGAPLLTWDRISPVEVNLASGLATATWRRRYGDGHDLTLNANWDRQETAIWRFDTRTTLLPAGEPQEDLQNFNSNVIDQTVLKADFNRPLADKGKLQLGYELVFIDGAFFNTGGRSVGGAAISQDPALRDHFEAGQTRNDAYVTLERPFGALTVLGGLRLQSVNLGLTQVTLGTRYAQNYANLYPTLHLSYPIGEGRGLTASYSRRVNRPTFASLNPFLYVGSPQAANRGNPALTPERTDSFEAGYEHREGPSNVLVTLYYRSTGNAFTTLGTDLGNGVLLAELANAGERRNGGVELVKAGRLSPKLTYNLSANLYWSQIQAPGLGFSIDRSATTGFGRANLSWQVTPTDFVQLNLFANGKVLYPQGYASPNASGNIGYRRKVNDRLSWMLVAQDPFGTLKNEVTLDLPTGRITRTMRMNSRLYTFSIVRTFGGARPRDPNFDFAPGGSAGAGGL